jgi:hypothetical protein
MSKSLSLGVCWLPLKHTLSVNFSGINQSFAPCSIHILFKLIKFHKFWMSCECSNKCTKNEANWENPRPTSLALDPNAMSSIQEWGSTCTLILSCALQVSLIQWPERLHPYIDGPTYMQDSGKHLRYNFHRHQESVRAIQEKVGAMLPQSQAGRPGWGRPALDWGNHLNCLTNFIHRPPINRWAPQLVKDTPRTSLLSFTF